MPFTMTPSITFLILCKGSSLFTGLNYTRVVVTNCSNRSNLLRFSLRSISCKCSFLHKFPMCIELKRCSSCLSSNLFIKFYQFHYIGSAFLYTSHVRDNVKLPSKDPQKQVADEQIENKFPVSLLGMGRGRYSKLERKMLEKLQVPIKIDDDPSDILPVAVKLMLKENKSEALKFYPDLKNCTFEKPPEKSENETTENVPHFPFKPVSDTFKENAMKAINEHDSKLFKPQTSSVMKYLSRHLGQSEDLDEGINALKKELWRVNYGKPDPSIPVSKVKCGGCGAYLHCQDPSLAGYIPAEKFRELSEVDMLKTICQRCIFLKHYNMALNVNVHPNEYPNLISEIKDKIALVILIVDLCDFPCSIWPGIIDLIGPKRPIFVVGNKVDLLPCDSRGYLWEILLSLRQTLKDVGIDKGNNIKHVGLISAKTGYGIEQLINKLHKLWEYKGDVYLVGCTNVGKSTLFNTLLQTDYCKTSAVDIVQRATTSVWPGTTLNLLKFPIMRASGFMLYLRTMRLKKEKDFEREAEKVRQGLLKETKNPQYATLMGRVRMTMKEDLRSDDLLKSDSSGEPSSTYLEGVFNPENPKYAKGYFCLDTPGAVYNDQILNLLTTEELTKTLPKQIIVPRTYMLREAQTFFLAGLGRIDLLEIKKNYLSNRTHPNYVYITVFASSELPAHMVYTHEADLFYNMNLGTDLLAVPCGGQERLKVFPSLQGKEMEVSGQDWTESSADIVLSSAGWVSISLGKEQTCKLKAYTLEGRGCYLRQPSMLKFAVNLKGKRIKGTPEFENNMFSIHQKNFS